MCVRGRATLGVLRSAPMNLMPRRAAGRPTRSLVTIVLAASSLAIAVSACGSASTSPAPASPAATVGTSVAPSVGPASAAPASAAPTAASAPVGSGSVSPSSGAVAPSGSPGPSASPVVTVAIDPTLAALLPTTVGGVAVARATATEDAASTSPRFKDLADGFASVEAIAPSGSDIAIASIVRLRPDASAATFYTDWRSSFDAAACAPAGGVSTQETLTISGRPVDLTHCVQGASIYHVWLQGGRVLVSVLDIGTAGLGKLLVEGAKG